MAEMNFDPTAVPEDDRGPMDPVPAGEYELKVIDSDVDPTKTAILLADGTYSALILKLTHEIVSGPFANRKIWTRHNYRNPNPDTQRIGQREIADLCNACGMMYGIKANSNELHGIPYMARVGIEKDKTGQYSDRNKISRFLPRDSGGAMQPRQAVQPTPQQRPPTGNGNAVAPATTGNRPAFLNRRAS